MKNDDKALAAKFPATSQPHVFHEGYRIRLSPGQAGARDIWLIEESGGDSRDELSIVGKADGLEAAKTKARRMRKTKFEPIPVIRIHEDDVFSRDEADPPALGVGRITSARLDTRYRSDAVLVNVSWQEPERRVERDEVFNGSEDDSRDALKADTPENRGILARALALYAESAALKKRADDLVKTAAAPTLPGAESGDA